MCDEGSTSILHKMFMLSDFQCLSCMLLSTLRVKADLGYLKILVTISR